MILDSEFVCDDVTVNLSASKYRNMKAISAINNCCAAQNLCTKVSAR
jgi:hypothetical protein